MSELFRKQTIEGREIINPFRCKNDTISEILSAEHYLKNVSDRLLWVEKDLEMEKFRNSQMIDVLEKHFGSTFQTLGELQKLLDGEK